MTTTEKIGYMTEKLKGYKERASKKSEHFYMGAISLWKSQDSIDFTNPAVSYVSVASWGSTVRFKDDIDSEVDDLYNAFIEREPQMEEYVAKSEASKRAELEAEMEKLKAQLEL